MYGKIAAISAATVWSAFGVAAAVDFEKEVLPLLKDQCVDCHRAPYEENGKVKKPKGDLRLDGKGWILHGVDGDPIIMPGKPRTSLLLTVVSVPTDSDDIMPPKGDPLSRDQIDLLRRWIEEGASFGDWRGDEEGVPKKTNLNADRQPTALHTLLTELSSDVKEVTSTARHRAESVGAIVVPVYTNSPLVEVTFTSSEESVDNRALGQLADLAPNITRLDLSRTRVSDGGLFAVGKCTQLTRLSLKDTGVSSKGIVDLKGCTKLRYLNLTQTEVSDDVVPHLARFKELEKVYLWGSKMTEDGVQRLRKALPKTQIIWQAK